MSAAWTILKGRLASSENAFTERMRRSGSGSALALTLARLRISKEVSLSVTSSSSLDRRVSGVGRFRGRLGVVSLFEGRGSASLETDRALGACVFWLEDWARGVREFEFWTEGFVGAAGFVWTTLRTCVFFACKENAPPFWRWSKNPMRDGGGKCRYEWRCTNINSRENTIRIIYA